MKFSIHATIRGKPAKVTDEQGNSWLEQDGRKVNLGYDWLNVEAEWDDMFELVTVDGCAIAPALTCDNRKDANFLESSLVLIDIDSGMSIEELVMHPFYDVYGAGFYTTPSHTDTVHRFRIIHRLEQPLRNSETMRLLYRSLMLAYGNADAACKDAARLFYGTINCNIKEKRSNTLPNDVVNILVNDVIEQDATEVRVMNSATYAPLSDQRKQRVIDLLKASYIGQYEQWRNIGWGLRDGGFSLADFQNATQGMMNQKTPANAKAVWDNYRSGNITMGTVMHFLKTRHGEDCLKQDAMTNYFAVAAKEKIAIRTIIRNGAY